MSDTPNPVFQLQRLYLKDLSLEQPNSPAILLEEGQPEVGINLGVEAENVAEGLYEVAVIATVTAKVGERTLFLVEAKQAGIFEIHGMPQDTLQQVVAVACPSIVYPSLRAVIADICTRAGFPPVLLQEVNFQAMYESQSAAAQANGAATETVN